MTSRILRADDEAIANIKSVKHTENRNASTDLRPGCVASDYIEVTVYGAESTAPASGEALRYYKVDAEGNETFVGTFYAEPSIQSRDTYTFVACDIVDRLNVSFSERLLAIQSNFPMSLGSLVTEACNIAGVQLYTSDFPMHDMVVQSFYAGGLTCRDILQYAAEIACRFVYCDANEKIVFGWYAPKNGYRIYPTTGTNGEHRIAYKMGGLSYQSYDVQNVNAVAVVPINAEAAAYIYPPSLASVTAADPLGNGVVTLYNLVAVDDGIGNITLSGDFTAEDTSGNVEIVPGEPAEDGNCLVIEGNILLTNADAATMERVAQTIYAGMSMLPVYKPARAKLFPSENPFKAGDIVDVTDVQGVSFKMPIMGMVTDQADAVVEATGNKSYDSRFYGSDTSKQLRNLSNSIVQIDRLKVGYAEIDTAVIDSLEANGINADWINAGALTIEDDNDRVIFKADTTTREVKLGNMSVLNSGIAKVVGNPPVVVGAFDIATGFFPNDSSDTAFDSDVVSLGVDPNLYVNGNVAFTGKLYYVDIPYIVPIGGHHRELVSEITANTAKPTLGFVDDSTARASITIPAAGYVDIAPPSLPTGAKITSIAVIEYTSASGAFSPVPYGSSGDAARLTGASGVTISGLKLRFWYEVGV